MNETNNSRFRGVRRPVLVVDDEFINREMLGNMLADDYDVIYAENGKEALDIVRENADTLSIILLDVIMPVMDGFETLQILKQDEKLKRIPVIVLTSERSYEVRCLQLGASDFIKKPYDLPEVVQARVNRTIELSEATYIIKTTEHDTLTDLYNLEYFYQYAGQYDRRSPNTPMDAITIDIDHFHMLNELYGRELCNDLLIKLGAELNKIASEMNGIACRKGADVFLLYCPHFTEYEPLINRLQLSLTDLNLKTSVRLKMGIYPEVDKSIDLRSRFDRAKLARDPVHSFTQTISFYDDMLHKKMMLSQQLMNEVDAALEQKQFKVYYQPKYNIIGDVPYLSSAEALIRWIHPQLGMISPGVFIPLFEENGLVQKLDHYVWEETAAQMRRWKDKYGFDLPVSVNVSRIDMFDPNLIDNFKRLVDENGLETENYLLEITESAYTENAEQIVRIVENLRAAGFKVEMDDFGSGYSSLNMLAQMPIDVLKLDMSFIRDVLGNEKNLHILGIMMQIKSFLNVPIVAEGVEKKEQLDLLKNMGCDIVQGYYFSAPVPPEKFEKFIEERIRS